MKRTERQKQLRANFVLKITDDGYPIAYGHQRGEQTVIECCPLCGEQHFHGKESYYGHKVEHCVPENQKRWQKLYPETASYVGKGYYMYPMLGNE
jgi:hypothetical protein